MEYFYPGMKLFAGALAVASFIPYTNSILRGTTRPSKSTWCVWTLLGFIIAIAMWSKGTLNIQMVVIPLADLFILYLALSGYGVQGWSRTDTVCVVGAGVGILAWFVTQDATIGLVIALTVNAIGSWPTIEKSWVNPAQENSLSYLLLMLAGMIEIVSLGGTNYWTLDNALQPIYYAAAGGLIWALTSRNTTRRAYL